MSIEHRFSFIPCTSSLSQESIPLEHISPQAKTSNTPVVVGQTENLVETKAIKISLNTNCQALEDANRSLFMYDVAICLIHDHTEQAHKYMLATCGSSCPNLGYRKPPSLNPR